MTRSYYYPLLFTIFLLGLALPFLFSFANILLTERKFLTTTTTAQKWWDFQSIDTMKYSRDVAAAKLHDSQFDSVIEKQISDIAQTGATHVAIATPYDEEFFPFLERWVKAARKNKLKVWFRGNWSGWEGWFNYAKIDRKQHLDMTKNFISMHPTIFENGDVFSACPECENGGPGDPRNGDAVTYRQFLIDEYHTTKDAFQKINKDVQSNFNSMNGDVARLIMDKPTTQALDGIVTVDHYVSTGEQLANDIEGFANRSGGKVVLGEIGAPIPDIHGQLSEDEQDKWIADMLKKLTSLSHLVGISYWTNTGGSTQLWNDDGTPRKAVKTLTAYFHPKVFTGTVINETGEALPHVLISTKEGKGAETDQAGQFSIPYLSNDLEMHFTNPAYHEGSYTLASLKSGSSITLRLQQEDWLFKIRKFVRSLIGR